MTPRLFTGPLDGAGWRTLSEKESILHDLQRAATHANLPLLETPMSTAVTKLFFNKLMINALKRKPTTRPGVMVSGGSYQGKAESVCDVLARFEEAWLDLHHHLNPAAIASMGRPPNVRPYNLHRTRWIRRYHANMSECSEGFRRAVARVLPEAEQPQH